MSECDTYNLFFIMSELKLFCCCCFEKMIRQLRFEEQLDKNKFVP